jgi:hypothetical protein
VSVRLISAFVNQKARANLHHVVFGSHILQRCPSDILVELSETLVGWQ